MARHVDEPTPSRNKEKMLVLHVALVAPTGPSPPTEASPMYSEAYEQQLLLDGAM